MVSIRKGTPDDLDEIWVLVQDAVADMAANGNPQWDVDYPAPTHFAQALADGELYAACGEDGAILGVAVLNTWAEECYSELSGWQETPPALVIHKVAVSPRAHRTGVATALFQYAFALAEERGLRSIRMDTYSLNHRMQNLVRKYGFRCIGDVRFPLRPLPYRVFEKVL